ncbi:hypothetical protein Bca4012_077241 [Brassica carinata]|uniref:HMA domain-containing protein n=3 Tax=Brassica TaxID=3705 RepID=A0A0D3D781_BRAOL|nr:PREDICTED: heavy metal-associated isoprenylated plant protein 26 [Brassica oleracea var. oleracea]XP_013727251.1 heavy metal-associated isoprenylated plant protein 22-like [Brassica napus]KAF3594435.1 hypothetical protein DY000_02023603 [Brassica cretica]KAG2265398.1 hypothetical protein Bca52824_072477 [Brassica carinata]
MGALDFLSDYFSNNFDVSIRKRKKHKVWQTVNIKVKIDCDGCERKIKNAVSSMKGAKSVEVNRKMHKVTVSGYVDPKKVLKRVQSTGKKKAELWPYVPYTMVAYPYAAGAYDKRAPAGFVRKSEQAQAQPGGTDDKLMSLFSDENPNACIVM